MWHRAYQWSARNCLHKNSYSLYILCNVKLNESKALGWIMSTCAKLNWNKFYFQRICFKRNIFNTSFHEVMQFLGGTSSRCVDFISFGSVFALKYIHIEIYLMAKISHKFIRIECNKKNVFTFIFAAVTSCYSSTVTQLYHTATEWPILWKPQTNASKRKDLHTTITNNEPTYCIVFGCRSGSSLDRMKEKKPKPCWRLWLWIK